MVEWSMERKAKAREGGGFTEENTIAVNGHVFHIVSGISIFWSIEWAQLPFTLSIKARLVSAIEKFSVSYV
jgi:hypothetical protein